MVLFKVKSHNVHSLYLFILIPRSMVLFKVGRIQPNVLFRREHRESMRVDGTRDFVRTVDGSLGMNKIS